MESMYYKKKVVKFPIFQMGLTEKRSSDIWGLPQPDCFFSFVCFPFRNIILLFHFIYTVLCRVVNLCPSSERFSLSKCLFLYPVLLTFNLFWWEKKNFSSCFYLFLFEPLTFPDFCCPRLKVFEMLQPKKLKTIKKKNSKEWFNFLVLLLWIVTRHAIQQSSAPALWPHCWVSYNSSSKGTYLHRVTDQCCIPRFQAKRWPTLEGTRFLAPFSCFTAFGWWWNTISNTTGGRSSPKGDKSCLLSLRKWSTLKEAFRSSRPLWVG